MVVGRWWLVVGDGDGNGGWWVVMGSVECVWLVSDVG